MTTPRDHWTPVRYVAHEQRCYFCFGAIRKGSPGTSKGTRGTKAYYEASLNLWQCMECRAEETRADLARLEHGFPR